MLLGCHWASAQKKIVLNAPKMQHVEINLYDESDRFLLTLPATFNITNKNTLTIMVGGDIELKKNQAVFIFSEDVSIKQLLKMNKNISAKGPFTKKNPVLNSVLFSNRKMSLNRDFDDGYEIVKKNAKPVILEINGASSQAITFYLQFYVAKPQKKYAYLIDAKCKLVEVELITK
jgi:hypothetical protein